MASLGGGKSKSKSTVQNAAQRRAIFEGGLSDIAKATGQSLVNGQLSMPEYQGQGYVNPGQVSRLAGGDYDRLENSIREAQWAPIDALKTRRFADIDQSVADRGLYASGISDDTKQQIFTTDFLPAYQQAATQAVATRYGLEQSDNQAANTFNLASSGAENAFNLQDAAARNQAAWTPYEYLLNLYNQTGGSNTKSSGWNVNAALGQ